jgi:hypothetical protein
MFQDWCGSVTIAPPTFWENLTTVLLLFLALALLFLISVGIAKLIDMVLERRERRKPVRYGMRRIL